MRLIICILLVFFGSVSRLPAQPAPTVKPQVVAYSFASARYVAGESMTLVSAVAIGRLMAVVANTTKPKAGYSAVSVGPGVSVRFGAAFRILSIAAVTVSSDGTSIDVYAMPSLRVGRTQVDARVAWQQPVSGEVHRQLKINPLTVSVPVSSRFRVGVGAVMSAKEGSSVRLGFGPLVVVRVGGGVLTQELIAKGNRFEARFGYAVRL